MATDDVVCAPIRDPDDGHSRVVVMPLSYTTPSERADLGALLNHIQNYRAGRYTTPEFQYRIGLLEGASICGYELESDAEELIELIDEGRLDIPDDEETE